MARAGTGPKVTQKRCRYPIRSRQLTRGSRQEDMQGFGSPDTPRSGQRDLPRTRPVPREVGSAVPQNGQAYQGANSTLPQAPMPTQPQVPLRTSPHVSQVASAASRRIDFEDVTCIPASPRVHPGAAASKISYQTMPSSQASSAPGAKVKSPKKRRRLRSLLTILIVVCSIVCAACATFLVHDAIDGINKQHLREMRTVKVFQPINTLPPESSKEGGIPLASASGYEDGRDLTRWYRSHLSEADQQTYDQIESGLRAQESAIAISCDSVESLMRCFQYVMSDNVDIFWADESYEYMHYPSTGEVISIQPKYLCTKTERQDRQKKVDAIVAEALSNMQASGIIPTGPDAASDYERARFLYGWVADLLSYDAEMAQWQGLYDVCTEKVTACAGYSRLFEHLCRACDIDCVYVTGDAQSKDGERELHAWSMMELDGTYCYTDVTWGDKDGSRATDYSWLALTSNHIGTTHFLDDEDLGIEADDGRYEIWNVNSTSFPAYDTAAVQDRLYRSIEDGWETVSLFFNEDTEFEKAYNEIAGTSIYPTTIVGRYPDKFPFAYTEGVYAVRREAGLNVLTITWKYSG